MAQAGAQARSREERAHTFDRAVEAIGEDTPDPIRRLLLGGGALERLIGLVKGGRTGRLRIAQMPEHATADDRGQVDTHGLTPVALAKEVFIYIEGCMPSNSL